MNFIVKYMTKADIKSRLLILKQQCEGKRRNALRATDDIGDFEHGKAVAYEDIVNRLDNFIDKLI